jgi:hypothetical protein
MPFFEIVKSRLIFIFESRTSSGAAARYISIVVLPCHGAQEAIEHQSNLLQVFSRPNECGHNIAVFIHARLDVDGQAVIFGPQWRRARIAFVGLEIDDQPVMYLAIHFLKVFAGMVTVFAMCSPP